MDTPPTMVSSWVDLTSEVGTATPPLTGHWCCLRSSPSTPPTIFGSADYLRALREAQSCGPSLRTTPLASALVSRCNTCRNSGTISPKSPPNSPNVELAGEGDLQTVFINRVEPEVIEDFLWDWSSRPTSTPPCWWREARRKVVTKEDKAYSGRSVASLLLSNLVSLLLGAGLGVWLYRRSCHRGLQILVA